MRYRLFDKGWISIFCRTWGSVCFLHLSCGQNNERESNRLEFRLLSRLGRRDASLPGRVRCEVLPIACKPAFQTSPIQARVDQTEHSDPATTSFPLSA